MVRLVKAFSVGGSLTGLTVSKNELLDDNVPSLTVIVIRLVPKAFAVGLRETVRLVPEPPNTTFAFATRLALVELAERMRESAGVSKSLMVKELLATLSSFVVTSGMLEMVGGLLTVNTVLTAFVNPGALAVSCLFVPPASISRLVYVTVPVPPPVPMFIEVVPSRGPVPDVSATETVTLLDNPVVELLPNWSCDFTTGCV